jgi:L-threonylcarbamoyladenylate synthase
MEKEIKKAVEVVQSGGVILYPTDTIWGIGCDATDEQAVEKVYEIKKRNECKALISLVSTKEDLTKITQNIPVEAENKNPTTIIYSEINGLAKNLLAENGSAAIRIVQDEFCKRLIAKLNKPIVSTSANLSGAPSPTQFTEIADEIKNTVDYIVNLRQNEIMTTPSEILLINTDGSLKRIR